MNNLPDLKLQDLSPTRDYLHEVAQAIGSLQLAFLPKEPHFWQYGLEVSMRGLLTQEFEVSGEPKRAVLDLVKYKVRFDGQKWALHEHTPSEIFEDLKKVLKKDGMSQELEEPDFSAGVMLLDTAQVDKYAEALWWMDMQLKGIKGKLKGGLVSPILIYPHHFDLALTWFPWNDERQISIGFSTGDEIVHEPYVYFSAYPEQDGFKALVLPKEAHLETKGFNGAVLPYKALSDSKNPEKLLEDFALFSQVKDLFS